ncbi:hypothetical protein GOICGAJE_02524 [Bacillus sp. MB95]|nr:hypothetical protein [Bacillus sp. MB95]
MFKLSFFNVILRGVTLASKFIFVLYITKYLTPEEVGVYGIVNTTILISIYLLGMDFFTFNTREMLKKNKKEWPMLFFNQAVFHAVIYCIILPIMSLLFLVGIIPVKYIFLVYLLMILEHISQELNRLLINMSKPFVANIGLFFRSGIWAYMVVCLFVIDDKAISIFTVLVCWCIGNLICIIFSIFHMKNLEWKKIKSEKVNWIWIKKGFVVAFPLFIGNISFKLVELSDRYFIGIFHDNSLVGVYTFYANIANLVLTFTNTGIIMVLGPKIINSYQVNNLKEYKDLMKKMTRGVIISCIIVGSLASVGILPVINYIGKEIYGEYLIAYWLLILSVIFSTLSLIPHHILYVRYRDKEIIISSIVSMLITIGLHICLVPSFKIIGASVGTLIGMFSFLSIKIFLSLRNVKGDELEYSKASNN